MRIFYQFVFFGLFYKYPSEQFTQNDSKNLSCQKISVKSYKYVNSVSFKYVYEITNICIYQYL
jgi:hypothetical protein